MNWQHFQQILAAQPGVLKVDEVPSLRARIVSVDGVPADQVKATPDTQWALRGDRGLTYSKVDSAGLEAGGRVMVGERLRRAAARVVRRRDCAGVGHACRQRDPR